MSDRKLLELAAKAAGVVIGLIDAMHEPEQWMLWNPLDNDCDALRLAVKLGLTIVPNYHVSQESMGVIVFTELEDGPDPYATTRRAIVRAAAEIGKATA